MKKNHTRAERFQGFTLVELMVAMAITIIIVSVLLPITSIATETWNRSRLELRASRQAKAMIDAMSKDFESMVTRRGSNVEWMATIANSGGSVGNSKVESSNCSDVLFFSSSMDRYNGNLGTTMDKGGDVCGIAYRLYFKDPIEPNGNVFQSFVFHRLLVNPDQTFNSLLGKTDLVAAFKGFDAELDKSENYVCENIYQFSLTYYVDCTTVTGTGANQTTQKVTVPVTISKNAGGLSATQFRLKGTGIETDVSPTKVTIDELKAGRVSSVEFSVTVLTDLCMDQLRERSFPSEQKRAEFIDKNSYNFSKRVIVPSS